VPGGRDGNNDTFLCVTNAGPVLFPMTQPGAETSGVVVGASGYGFVPPGGNRSE